MSTFINIQVTFDKPYQFNLLRENLNWQQLATVIQSSIPEAANKETLSLYYTLNDEAQTISNQDHLSQLLCLVTNDILGVRLYGQTQENMEPALIMPRSNDAFKQLSEFADLHYSQLETNPCLAKMVGFLAARVVYSPEKPIDEELNQIEEWIRRGATMDRVEFKRMMKERKVMWKQGHRKMRSKTTEGDEESFEFAGSNPNRHRHRHRRHHGDPGVPVDDESPDSEKSARHVEDKHSDSSSESESGNEGGRRRCGRGGRRHGKHHGNPFGPAAAEFFTRFGSGHRYGRHGFGGPGFEGEHHHAHGHREDVSNTDTDDFSRGFGRKGHHGRHGKKHAKHFGGEKYFVFA